MASFHTNNDSDDFESFDYLLSEVYNETNSEVYNEQNSNTSKKKRVKSRSGNGKTKKKKIHEKKRSFSSNDDNNNHLTSSDDDDFESSDKEVSFQNAFAAFNKEVEDTVEVEKFDKEIFSTWDELHTAITEYSKRTFQNYK
jgi:hypothetical protein